MTNALGVSRQTIIAIKNDTYNLSLEIAVKIGGCCGNRAIFFLRIQYKQALPFRPPAHSRAKQPRAHRASHRAVKETCKKQKQAKKTSLVLLAQGF